VGIGLHVDTSYYEIGAGSFFHSFCSTVSYHLEPDGWGSRYPVLMIGLYQGSLAWQALAWQYSAQALKELADIHEKLKAFAPDRVIWDIDDLSKRPPWGDDISSDITDLSNYFVTSDGQDLFEVMTSAFAEATEKQADIYLQ